MQFTFFSRAALKCQLFPSKEKISTQTLWETKWGLFRRQHCRCFFLHSWLQLSLQNLTFLGY